MKPYILSITNQKGGVAKTTSVANIGAALALQGNQVLLIDLDPQAHLTDGLGIKWNTLERTIYHVLEGTEAIENVIHERPLVGASNPLQVLPASLALTGSEIKLSMTYGREFLLRNALEEYAVPDYVIIDCPPSLGLLTVNALVASNGFCIPVEPEYYAKKGIEQTLRAFQAVRKLNAQLEIAGAFITKFDVRRLIHTESLKEVKDYFGELLFETIVRIDTNLSEAPQLGQTIFEYSPNTRGAGDYFNLTTEIIQNHG